MIALWKRLVLLTQTRISGGSSDTELTAVAVIAYLMSFRNAVTMVTPETNRPIT
jgi:hypothetical protein